MLLILSASCDVMFRVWMLGFTAQTAMLGDFLSYEDSIQISGFYLANFQVSLLMSWQLVYFCDRLVALCEPRLMIAEWPGARDYDKRGCIALWVL